MSHISSMVGILLVLADTLRSLKEEITSCKADNDKILRAQEKQEKLNAILLQSLSDL